MMELELEPGCTHLGCTLGPGHIHHIPLVPLQVHIQTPLVLVDCRTDNCLVPEQVVPEHHQTHIHRIPLVPLLVHIQFLALGDCCTDIRCLVLQVPEQVPHIHRSLMLVVVLHLSPL